MTDDRCFGFIKGSFSYEDEKVVLGLSFVKMPRIKKTYPCHFDRREKSYKEEKLEFGVMKS